MRWLLTLSLTCAAFLMVADDAAACTCREPGPACETAWTADAVFVGEVVAIETIAGERRARLRVSESFRGDASGVVEIVAGRDGVDLCLYPFIEGVTYLVYALESTVGYTTSICMRTRPIANAADDLAYLRSFNRARFAAGRAGRRTAAAEVTIADARGCAAVDIAAQANGRIAGRGLDARGRPITGWAVEAQRLGSPLAAPGTRRMTQTNSAGRYEIGPLHPGRYLVGIYTGQREPVLLTSPRNGTAPDVVTIVFGERVAIADVTIPD